MLEQIEDKHEFYFWHCPFFPFYFSMSETGPFQWTQLNSNLSFLTPDDKHSVWKNKTQ
jgi:hypothetical protein